ncbi:MAG: hypothetical protein K2K53_13960, partial [Oscillospiraceae bacterium]|nr:hypothetical protein [Oscillospiraceae bacterium]
TPFSILAVLFHPQILHTSLILSLMCMEPAAHLKSKIKVSAPGSFGNSFHHPRKRYFRHC